MDYIARAVSADGFLRIYACRTTDTVAEAARIHDLSATAAAALGRTLTAAAMMGAMIKDEGTSVTIKIDGGGPIGSILAVTDNTSMVRGYVDNPHADAPSRADGHLNVGAIVGTDGFLTVTRDYGLKEPYSGSVPLVTGEIGDDITAYFAASEQTPSAVGLGVLVDTDLSVKCAGGFIVQLMPGATDDMIDKIEAGIQKAGTVSKLLDEGMDGKGLLETVLSEFELEILEQTPVAYRCYCSRERVTRTLISLGRKELQDIVDEGKPIDIDCQFCDEIYHYTPEDIADILKEL